MAASKAKQVEEKATRRRPLRRSVKKLENTGKAASALAVSDRLVGLAAGGGGAYLWFRSTPGAAAPTATVYPLAGSRAGRRGRSPRVLMACEHGQTYR